MNQKDKKEIGLNMAILMESILDERTEPEIIANRAITFCSEMFKKYPELTEYTEDMTEGDFDKYVSWINWEKEFLKK